MVTMVIIEKYKMKVFVIIIYLLINLMGRHLRDPLVNKLRWFKVNFFEKLKNFMITALNLLFHILFVCVIVEFIKLNDT